MFNFQVNQNLFYALAASDTRPLVKALKATRGASRDCTMGPFSAEQ
jgi:maltose alpha-D-glucosyltransferase/alpha-amylase